ncbi:MAG: hypothetical protein ACJ8J0_00940 [Longimicrobiaceae bacterium]
METIFEVGGHRPLLIRLVMPLCSLLMGVPMVAVGWLFLNPGSWGPDGDLTGPHWLGILFGLAFLLGGIGIAVGAWLYGPAYVTRIEADREQQLARFSVLGWVRGWSFTVRPEDIVSGRYHEGSLDTGRHRVYAPWTTVRIRGRRLPLIVDAGALQADWKVLDRLLEQRTLELSVRERKRLKKRG